MPRAGGQARNQGNIIRSMIGKELSKEDGEDIFRAEQKFFGMKDTYCVVGKSLKKNLQIAVSFAETQ